MLVISAAPRITQGLSTVTMATEWTTVTLVCNISTSLEGITVSWGREGGVIPLGNIERLTDEVHVQPYTENNIYILDDSVHTSHDTSAVV